MKHDKNSAVYEKAVCQWQAPEYAHHEKSARWFAIAALAALLLVIWGIQSNDWTFSIVVIVFCGTYYLLHRHRPQIVRVKISRFGVKFGRHVYPFSHIKGFWIVYQPPFVKRLYLRVSGKLHPDIFISLEDEDPSRVRKILLEHLDELKGRHEPLSDCLIRLFRL